MAKKIRIFILTLLCLTFFVFQYTAVYADNSIYLGGMTAGFEMELKGAYIMGISGVITENGKVSPAENAGLKVGDVILSLDGEEVSDAQSLENIIKDGKTKIVKYVRNSKENITNITPAKDALGNYKLGVYIRNALNGIGTITYIRGNSYASLGHPVLSEDGELLFVKAGEIRCCNITGVVKGKRGRAGELRGSFVNNIVIGSIDKNTTTGIYGKINNSFKEKYDLKKIETGTAVMGDAYIYSTVSDGEIKKYDISIIKTDYSNKENKNFVIKIEDEELIEITGGIVQGMSGSPIVQNGKLVGAVTHVFLNDSTRGFGIAIENMLKNG